MTRPWARLCAGVFAFLALALAAAGPASAQSDADGLKLDLGYDGRLLFLTVLKVEFNEHVTATGHASSARISSYGLLDAVKHFNIDATETGQIVHGDPEPGVFKHENHDGKRNRKVEVVWEPTDVVTTAQPPMTYLGDPPANRQQRLGAVGYLTAVMRLTIAADSGPCRGAETIFNGKELSEIGFSDPRPTTLSAPQKTLGLVNSLRCNAAFKEIAGYKKKKGKAQNQGLDRPVLVDFAQVGEGGPWVIARLQAHTQLGDAVIELARLNKQGRMPEGIVQGGR
jgi:hypothetical protein